MTTQRIEIRITTEDGDVRDEVTFAASFDPEFLERASEEETADWLASVVDLQVELGEVGTAIGTIEEWMGGWSFIRGLR